MWLLDGKKEALVLCGNNPSVNIDLMDMMMLTGMDGYEITKEIK